MEHDFPYTTLGKTKLTVSRLGLAATYRPGKRAVFRAIDEGVNYFFWFNIDNQMIKVLRDILKLKREIILSLQGGITSFMVIRTFAAPLRSGSEP